MDLQMVPSSRFGIEQKPFLCIFPDLCENDFNDVSTYFPNISETVRTGEKNPQILVREGFQDTE